MEALKNEKSDINVIIAISALGMGICTVNFPNVVLYVPPSIIIELVQEICRVGREGKEAVALLLHNLYH